MKKLLIVIGALIVLLLVAAAAAVMLAPNDIEAEREIVINKPRAEVFDYVKNMKNQNDWAVWAKRDPNMKQEFRGNDGEVGAVSSWVSETEGTGEQEIMKIEDGKRVDFRLRFKAPFEAESDAWVITEDAGENQTKVKWGFKGNMPAPWNVMMLFIDMNGAIGKDYEEGLANLKTILEGQ